ncbi:preprotein translocase subunit YajC [Flexivirga meconopsidis]|uniref:preprotein translocase subunit YajC n=1 Tax=Flexivirga meconopsidis TaxID=2977121 RepID=UPI0022408DEC|nr:preprotein translocase subunit YajC [Flexivirga meconopsidis]
MGTLLFLIPLVLLAWLFWLQRRRQQQMQKAQSEITVGSEVSTTSGLLGTLVAMDDEIGTIEVAPGVQLRFDRRAIVPRTQLRPGGAASVQPAEGAVDQPKTEQPKTDLTKSDASDTPQQDNNPETKAD